jgi:hypothetical protein
MTMNEFNLMQGSQLPYPNYSGNPMPITPSFLGMAPVNAGQLPYPNYQPTDPLAPMNPAFQLSGYEHPYFSVQSPIIPSSMLTPTYSYGENVAQVMYPNQLGSTQAVFLTAQPTVIPGGEALTQPLQQQGRGDLRQVLEPILLADILLGL